MSLFCCPICGVSLDLQARTYRCQNGHAFDLAKEGYVHLLPVSKKRTALPGDNKEMVQARSAFLECGYYAHLAELLTTAVQTYHTDNVCNLLDSGCGEGYYTQFLYQALLKEGINVNIYGVDLSKEAVRRAAKRLKDGRFAVASVYHLPLADHSMHAIVNCFSPMSETEFLRVLKPGGYLFYVVPAPYHLWQLKQVLYENPYPNESKIVDYAGFTHVETLHASAERLFANAESIRALFAMTPYAYRTPEAGRARMMGLESLTCTCAFDVHVYRCEKNEKNY